MVVLGEQHGGLQIERVESMGDGRKHQGFVVIDNVMIDSSSSSVPSSVKIQRSLPIALVVIGGSWYLLFAAL